MLFAAEEAGGGNPLLTFLPLILLIAAMYFLLIRPQAKRRREALEMQSRLAPGDEVQTVGGLFATVSAVDDDLVMLEAAPGVQLRYARGAIARVVTKPGAATSGDEGGDTTTSAEKS